MLLKFGGVHGIFWAGTIFAVIEIVLIAMQFKNTNTADHDKHLDYNSFTIMIKYFKKDHIRQLLISLAFLGIGGFIVNASMGLYMQGLFNTSGSQYGLYLGIAGVIGALNMGYLIPKFWLRKFSPDTLNVINHISLIV
jgi:predicted MFS family arabinose efflux permease